ncbi:MAG: hypothetical protein SGPRY_000815 [Prymnesium sp.]
MLSLALCVLAAGWALVARSGTTSETQRTLAATRAARHRLSLLAQHGRQIWRAHPPLVVEIELRERAEARQLTRLRALLRTAHQKQQLAYAASSLLRHSSRRDGTESGVWHGVGGDGSCPARIPQWDWGLLLSAAISPNTRLRYEALNRLGERSRLSSAELQQMTSHYRAVLQSQEFSGILNISHPPCDGRRFASLQADRVLHIDCAEDARYAVDDSSDLLPYTAPVRLPVGESIIAFCGQEMNLLASPLRDATAAARARAVPQPSGRRPSVLVFMIDATSRAHFRRSLPKTLAALQLIARNRSQMRDEGSDASRAPPAAVEESGQLHVFDFEWYNVIGYNSLPNQLPLYCDVTPEVSPSIAASMRSCLSATLHTCTPCALQDLSALDPSKCVWEEFKRQGGVTMIAEEVHDGCEGVTSIANSLIRDAYLVNSSAVTS